MGHEIAGPEYFEPIQPSLDFDAGRFQPLKSIIVAKALFSAGLLLTSMQSSGGEIAAKAS